MMSQSNSARQPLCRFTCRCLCLGIAACASVFSFSSPVAADLIYRIVPIAAAQFQGDGPCSLDGGFIKTDGTLGTITSKTKILDWSVLTTTPLGTGEAYEMDKLNSVFVFHSQGSGDERGIFATLTGLYVGRLSDVHVTRDTGDPNDPVSLDANWAGRTVSSHRFNLIGAGPEVPRFVAAVPQDNIQTWLIATREVPEPATILLWTIGMVVGGSYGIWRRKRRLRNATVDSAHIAPPQSTRFSGTLGAAGFGPMAS